MPEWIKEKNQWGGIDRYFIDGYGHKVHEGRIDGVLESQYDEFKARERAEALERLKKQNQANEKFVVCPFRMLRDCASLKCIPECVHHTADGCGMVADAPLTGGTICPMKPGFKCSAACALYADGCKLKLLFTK